MAFILNIKAMISYKQLQEKLYLELVKETLNEAGLWSAVKGAVGASRANNSEKNKLYQQAESINQHLKNNFQYVDQIINLYHQVSNNQDIQTKFRNENFVELSKIKAEFDNNLGTMQVLADDISKQFKASSIFDQAITAMQKYQTETLTKLYNYIQQMLRDIETKRKTGDNNFMDLNSGIAAALYKAKSELLNIAQQIFGINGNHSQSLIGKLYNI